MKSLEELKALSEKNGVPFEELCSYALESIEKGQSLEKSKEKAVSTDKIEKK